MSEETLTLQALVESNDMLQEELNRVRNTNRVLRTVVRQLRTSLTTLREQVAVAAQNDETFKAFCEGQFDVRGSFEHTFDVKGTNPTEAGLAEAGSQVESAG
jgi:hypothetical protein